FRLVDILGKAPVEPWGHDEASVVIDEAYKFACEVLRPLNAAGGREGGRIEYGAVKTPKGFKEAWKQIYEAGWKSVAVSPEWEGQGAPFTLWVAIEEFLSGANTAFNMYPGLAHGAAEVIEQFGTDEQKQRYLANMYSGR